jgi:sorting nexin-27
MTTNTNDFTTTNYIENRNSITSDSTNNSNNNNNNINFDPNIKIKLPDNSVCLLTIKQNQTTDEVYSMLIKNIQLDTQLASYFYLFEIIDDSFERKLRPNDIPYSIYVQNYNNTNRIILFKMKKWYFNLRKESILAKNNQTLQYLFHQVIN